MDFSQLRRGEVAAVIGGLLLIIAVFLPAYSPSDNPNAEIVGRHADASIWDANKIHRILLLLAAIAPIVLIYIVLRRHELSWLRGELTAVIGLTATTLVIWDGVIQRPGAPSGQVSLNIGWFV